MINNKICNICQKNPLFMLHFELPTFRHVDFTTISKEAKLLKCPNCQTISNPDAINGELSTFKTKHYAFSHQTDCYKHTSGFVEPVTRSFIQAKILSKKLKDENQRILDIDCFDGSLLIELDQLLEFFFHC